MLNKLSCSLTNSAAIGNEGQIYVWGSGKYGFSGDKEKFLMNSPTDIKFREYYPAQNLKAIHISCGLNHMAAIVVDSNFFDEIHQKLLEIHKKHYEIFEGNDNPMAKKIMTKKDLETLFKSNHHKLTKKEESKISSYIDIFFKTDEPLDRDYYESLLSGKEPYKKAMIWGCSDNYRLGLDGTTIELNEAKEKRAKFGEFLHIESGSSEGEVSDNIPIRNPETKLKLKSNIENILVSSMKKSKFVSEVVEEAKENKNITAGC